MQNSVKKNQDLYSWGESAQLTQGKCNYFLEGTVEGPLVVFLTGILDFSGRFEKIASSFRELGYCTLRFDWYGHGLSDMPRTLNYTVDMYIQQVEDLLEHLGLNARPV
eukprot:Platyproteum_vivax@DN11352_c0_g1_i1.p1